MAGRAGGEVRRLPLLWELAVIHQETGRRDLPWLAELWETLPVGGAQGGASGGGGSLHEGGDGRRQGDGGGVVRTAAGAVASGGGVLRHALRVELDAGGRGARRADGGCTELVGPADERMFGRGVGGGC